MSKQTIWPLRPGSFKSNGAKASKIRKAVYESAKRGKSRYGWSTHNPHNLHLTEDQVEVEIQKLKQGFMSKGCNLKDYDHALNPKTVKKWRDQARFLQRDIEPGHWIVHINVPGPDKCVATKVIGSYGFYPEEKELCDYRHYIDIDSDQVKEFNRRDAPSIFHHNLGLLTKKYPYTRQNRWVCDKVEEFRKFLESLPPAR